MNHKILSKNLTRPKNKAEAFALLQDIRKSVQDTNAIDETPLDELLLYFCTKPKPKARISWDWVALAALCMEPIGIEYIMHLLVIVE